MRETFLELSVIVTLAKAARYLCWQSDRWVWVASETALPTIRKAKKARLSAKTSLLKEAKLLQEMKT